jgi:hypothetical protein
MLLANNKRENALKGIAPLDVKLSVQPLATGGGQSDQTGKFRTQRRRRRLMGFAIYNLSSKTKVDPPESENPSLYSNQPTTIK